MEDLREVEAHETDHAPRGQKEPPPEARPGMLSEPGPQRSDRTVLHSSSDAPLLAAPSLAGGDCPDETVAFLIKELMLVQMRKTNEEKIAELKRQKAEVVEALATAPGCLLAGAASVAGTCRLLQQLLHPLPALWSKGGERGREGVRAAFFFVGSWLTPPSSTGNG